MRDAAADITRQVVPLLHAEKRREAAQCVCDLCRIDLKVDSDDPALTLPPLTNWLHFLLNSDRMPQAAAVLWKPNQFTAEPQFTKDIWALFDSTSTGLLMGGASVTKSYSMGVRLYLEWVRDPEYTSVNVVGPSEDHLEKNLFSHLVSLHDKASLPQPGQVGELFIGRSRRDQLGSIKGVVIPVGRVKKAGRLQGTKRMPRPEAHPLFGSLSRMMIFIDEIENVPAGLWKDIDNVLANTDGETGRDGGFKVFGAYNPTNQHDEVGKRAEPDFGWEKFDLETHYRWKSKRGWDVLRLDGEQSENVKAGKVIYPGIQTRAGLEAIARNSGGKQSAGYVTMGRGAYPLQGVELTVIPPGMLGKMRGTFIWYEPPAPIGSSDLALEGGAGTVPTLGKFGKATGMKLIPSLEYPKGQTIMFKDARGQVAPRYALQADHQFVLPKGETMAVAESLITFFKRAGVRPESVAVDRTGHGAGVADMMKHMWSAAVHDVNYSEGCTGGKLMQEDTKTCKEQYERMWSELWFGLRAWAEFGYLLLSPELDLTNLSQQLTQRKFRIQNARSRVESKRDYMSRGFPSPDEADSLTLLVYVARMVLGVPLSMKGEIVDPDEADDGWYDGGLVRIDPSNHVDSLDDSIL
jgi:hypothetical protein